MNKTPIARQNHYVPEFYLAGFTPSGKTGDFLWVHDKKSKKHWKVKPEKVARERDFYRLEIPDVEPDIVEKEFSKFESRASSVIREIQHSGSMPGGESFVVLMNLIAMMATRVPGFRQSLSKPLKEIGEKILRMIACSSDHFKDFVDNCQRHGIDSIDMTSYESLKKQVEDGELELEVNPEWLTGLQLESYEFVLPELIRRNWTLAINDNPGTSFITSDRPAVLMPLKPLLKLESLGFADADTELVFPLNKRHAMLGRFEGYTQIVKPTGRQVIALNTAIYLYSDRYVYSDSENITLSDKERRLAK